MRRALAALAVALGAITVMPSAAQADDPARVLIVGDSVTQGYKGEYTWRYFLWKALEQQQVSVDFVGTRTGPFSADNGEWDFDYQGPDAYADPDFDHDHAAFYGGRLGPPVDSNDGWGWFYHPISETVAATQPDVIVSMFGINDLARADIGPAELVGTYREWVADARTVNPDVDFVLGRLPYTWLYDGEVVEFNALLGGLADELSTEESTVTVTAGIADYTQAADARDHVHPTTSGYRKIAAMVGDSLVPMLGGGSAPVVVPPAPAPVQVTPPAVPELTPPVVQMSERPAKPAKVRAVQKGKRVVVTWRSVAGADSYRVKCGNRSATTPRTKATLKSLTGRCKVQAVSDAGASAWARARRYEAAWMSA